MAHLLFIDDEIFEMRGVLNSLRRKHQVTEKVTGADGLAELRNHHQCYDLVILDLMLPRGEALDPHDRVPQMPREEVGEFIYQKMGEICPAMPIVILTAVRSNMVGMVARPRTELVQKPVKMAELLHRIQTMLEKGSHLGSADDTS